MPIRTRISSVGRQRVSAGWKRLAPAEAVSQISVSEGSRDGIVIDELERGYSMNGQLLRPARVRVGHHE